MRILTTNRLLHKYTSPLAIGVIILILSGCDMLTLSPVDFLLDHTAVVSVAGAEGRENALAVASGVAIMPGASVIALKLNNPRNIPLKLSLDAPELIAGGGTISCVLTQNGAEALVTITGAVLNDELRLTLRIGADGRDFAPYTFTVRCLDYTGFITYTVTFNTGGHGSIPSQTVNSGSTVSYPAAPTVYPGYDVEGWYTDSGYGTPWNFTAAVTGNRTLYANWQSEDYIDSGGTSIDSFQTVNSPTDWVSVITFINSQPDGGKYVINLSNNINLPVAGTADNPKIASNRTVSIRGNHTITLESTSGGSLLYLDTGTTVILRGPTLVGKSSNSSPLVYVSIGDFYLRAGTIRDNNNTSGVGGGVYLSSGNFIMSGGTIRNNTAGNGGGMFATGGSFTMSGGIISDNTTNSNGGGVYFGGGSFTMTGGTIGGTNIADLGGGVYYTGSGTFTLSGGVISDNTSSRGGGVFISSGNFTMSGGTISDNTSNGGSGDDGGGGVYVAGGNFSMNGGTISSNTAGSGNGGGVYVNSGNFSMSGGTISSNSTSNSGGGVRVDYWGNFTMSGGTISDNTSGGGGGVNVGAAAYASGGTFTMSGGTISGNSSSGNGGGVNAHNGTFTMNGGTISGNSSSGYGGGVNVGNDGTFAKNGGTITGTGGTNPNTAGADGQAVFAGEPPLGKHRDATAGPGVSLDSTYTGSIPGGGWE